MSEIIIIVIFSIGPFTDINAEEVEEEIGGMYRTVLKLTKTFGDAPGPRRVADSVKTKIDKFKVHIPLLQIICNPGLRDRHWEQVGRHCWFSHDVVISSLSVKSMMPLYVGIKLILNTVNGS